MKKFLPSLILLFTLLAFGAKAQTANQCNPQFSTQFLSGSLIKFNPAITTDSPYVSHTWYFGDGSNSTAISPIHQYGNGFYTAKHFLYRQTPGGFFVCYDSSIQQITITQSTCNLNAHFYSGYDYFNPYIRHYANQTFPLNPGDSIRWIFGDGTSSNQQNPIHTFAAPGIYTVCLRVIKQNTLGTNNPCISEFCRPDTIIMPVVSPCNMQAYFSQNADSANQQLIHFTNQSPGYLPSDTIRWTFGDGTSSTQVNPTHAYANAGVYNVCLRLSRPSAPGTPPCVREYCNIVTIASPCNLAANFAWYRDSTISAPNSYHFTNTSVPLSSTDSIRWTFGDGTSSSQMNPNHAYTQPGTFTVCLRVIKRNSAGVLTNCISEICHAVVVQAPCNLTANFTPSLNPTAPVPNSVLFINTSAPISNTDSIRWTFGDGTSSTQINPNHAYAQPGTYNVCLRIIKRTGTGFLTNCISEVCHAVIVPQPTPPPPSCNQLSAYQFAANSANAASVTFTPNYIDSAVQYTWTFGDGTGSQNPTATHLYAAPGYYTACLTAYTNNNCASTTCRSVYVPANCNNITLGFSESPDSIMPNRIKFTGNSNTFMPNQRWTITKMPANGTNGTATIYQNNPTYVFLDSGYYNVCLRVTFAGGCVKEYCRSIHIAQSVPGTSTCVLPVYPNPASTVINAAVALTQPLPLNAYIYNSMNMLVAQKQQQGVVGLNTVSINIANLPAGVYSVRLYYGNNLCTSTFIKL